MRQLPAAREGFKIGQRVLAAFSGPPLDKNMVPKLGVITGEFSNGTYPVQFQPCGAHWHCHNLSAYGDANGWTDEEYRVEREKSYSEARAKAVESERRRRYPDKPFSTYREPDLTGPLPLAKADVWYQDAKP